MLIREAILDIRNKVSDNDNIEYSDDELLVNLKEAIQYVGAYLVNVNSPATVDEILIETEEFDVPKNYTKSAGVFPVKISGSRGKLLCEPPVRFRYLATYKDIGLNDEMPYNHATLWQIMIKLASIYALNRNEFNIQQDKALLDEINQQLAAVVS